jgi:hypothetical protein
MAAGSLLSAAAPLPVGEVIELLERDALRLARAIGSRWPR